MQIVFVLRSKVLNPRDHEFIVAATDLQMRRDFAPSYGIEPWPCQAVGDVANIDQSLAYPIFVLDKIGDPSALGFHDDALGYIYGRVAAWSDPSTWPHEAAEMRADAPCNKWVLVPADAVLDPAAEQLRGKEVAYEVSDAVEADAYPVEVTVAGERRTILVSNFVMPNWFVPGSPGPWDWMGLLKAPLTMTRGGYLIVRDPATGEVTDLFSDRATRARLALKRADPTSRTARRFRR